MSKASSEVPAGRARPAKRRTRAKWRSLVDFQPLFSAERKLLAACEVGEVADVGDEVPSKKPGVRIRADFLKFLMLGGDEGALLADSGVQLSGAFIEGQLSLESVKIAVPLKFHKCQFESLIYAFGAEFESISFEGSKLKGLNAEASRIKGALFLTAGCQSEGIISLTGAKVFFLICTDASFASSGGRSGKGRDAIALNLQAAKIESAFIWRRIRSVQGCLFLASAKIGTLNDDIASWRKADNIVLDGFEYERIDSQEMSAESRIGWISLQKPGQYDEKFWSQPWEYLAGFLRQMGHVEDAKLVAIKKQQELRRLKIIGGKEYREDMRQPAKTFHRIRVWTQNKFSRLLHRLYGGLAGYGHRPMRTFTWMVAAWGICAAAYSWGEAEGLFVPSAPLLQTSPQFSVCGMPGDPGLQPWTRCRSLPPEHTKFSPIVYSLDVVLPLVDLRQEADWAPAIENAQGETLWLGFFLRALMWIQILFGWITSLLLVAALGRLVQKE
jgi:hypothetical protein